MLVYHPESDSLFWDANFKFEGADGALCDDVSETKWALDRAKAEGIVMSSSKNPYEDNTPNESQIKDRKAMERAIFKAVYDGIERAKRCCFNCASFKEAGIYCMIHKANPPPRIVCFGCDQYTPSDEIPF
jgi:hypothetical protein